MQLSIALYAVVAIAILALAAVPGAEGYNILGVFPTTSHSHHKSGSALLQGLAKAGHNVTMIGPIPLAKPMPNYRDIVVLGLFELVKEMLPTAFVMLERGPLTMTTFCTMITNYTLNYPAVQTFLADPSERFDLIICEVFLNEAHLGFGHHFGAPIIAYSTFGANMWTNDLVGTPSPLSFVPHAFLGYTDRMSFGQRVSNTLMTVHEHYAFRSHMQTHQQIYDEVFKDAAKPSLEQLRRNVSLVLLNTHHTMGTPRPYMPNMIEIGGVHINRRARRELPDAMRQFVEGAGLPGVIYFSMGSMIRSADMPTDTQAAILRVLGALPQRVLWKWENAELPNKPANVLVAPWFPQDDLLAHPAVRLFITHGGLLSTSEAVYHGVPLIGIPVVGDQMLNMARSEAGGFAVTVAYTNLTEQSLRWAIQEVLGNERYARAAKLVQQRYRDQPMEPLDLGIWWVEFVARHRGAPHMHSAGADLSWWVYHGLDVWATLLAAVLGVTLGSGWLALLCWRYVRMWTSKALLQKKEN